MAECLENEGFSEGQHESHVGLLGGLAVGTMRI